MRTELRKIPGGVCAPKGFNAGAVSCGIKPGGKKRNDYALIASDVPAVAAATFTTNRVKAAPVKVSMEHLRSAKARAVVLNSGNANACTGPDGIAHSRRTAAAVASVLNVTPQQVLVCSTGRIGISLPIERMEKSAVDLVGSLNRQGSSVAAAAIMTSDTVSKEMAVSIKGFPYRVGGIAKGAGMIDPNMATMLAVLTTDAPVSKPLLRRILKQAVENSFNRITVDGDMSTNDTVILLANGLAGGDLIAEGSDEHQHLAAAVLEVCRVLARKIVEDGEGTTRVIELEVRGAASPSQARRAAEAVADSTLAKCAWAGGDPNWGRILDALGYSGVPIDPDQVDIFYEDLPVALGGKASSVAFSKLQKIAARPSFRIGIDLHQGNHAYEVWTTDLTEEYVRLNLGE